MFIRYLGEQVGEVVIYSTIYLFRYDNNHNGFRERYSWPQSMRTVVYGRLFAQLISESGWLFVISRRVRFFVCKLVMCGNIVCYCAD